MGSMNEVVIPAHVPLSSRYDIVDFILYRSVTDNFYWKSVLIKSWLCMWEDHSTIHMRDAYIFNFKH